MFLGSWPPHMWCLKAKKNQTLIEFLDGTKKVQLAGKKSFLEFRGFGTVFLLLTGPMWCWNEKYPDRCTIFLLAKNYKPTWTHKHPSAVVRRMVFWPALEKVIFFFLNWNYHQKIFIADHFSCYIWKKTFYWHFSLLTSNKFFTCNSLIYM